MEKILDWFRFIFEKVRYPYELFDGYSKKEESELADLWVSLGAPSEEALVQYHPKELACLIAGIRFYIEPRLV